MPCNADVLLVLHRSYVHFCACGKQLDSRLEFLGAKRFADRIDVHKEDLPAIDRWLSGVTSALQALQLQTFQETGGVHEALLSSVQQVILSAQQSGQVFHSNFYAFVIACPCEAVDMVFLLITNLIFVVLRLRIDQASFGPSSLMQILQLVRRSLACHLHSLLSTSLLQHDRDAMFCWVNLHGSLDIALCFRYCG